MLYKVKELTAPRCQHFNISEHCLKYNIFSFGVIFCYDNALISANVTEVACCSKWVKIMSYVKDLAC